MFILRSNSYSEVSRGLVSSSFSGWMSSPSWHVFLSIAQSFTTNDTIENAQDSSGILTSDGPPFGVPTCRLPRCCCSMFKTNWEFSPKKRFLIAFHPQLHRFLLLLTAVYRYQLRSLGLKICLGCFGLKEVFTSSASQNIFRMNSNSPKGVKQCRGFSVKFDEFKRKLWKLWVVEWM